MDSTPPGSFDGSTIVLTAPVRRTPPTGPTATIRVRSSDPGRHDFPVRISSELGDVASGDNTASAVVTVQHAYSTTERITVVDPGPCATARRSPSGNWWALSIGSSTQVAQSIVAGPNRPGDPAARQVCRPYVTPVTGLCDASRLTSLHPDAVINDSGRVAFIGEHDGSPSAFIGTIDADAASPRSCAT